MPIKWRIVLITTSHRVLTTCGAMWWIFVIRYFMSFSHHPTSRVLCHFHLPWRKWSLDRSSELPEVSLLAGSLLPLLFGTDVSQLYHCESLRTGLHCSHFCSYSLFLTQQPRGSCDRKSVMLPTPPPSPSCLASSNWLPVATGTESEFLTMACGP